MAVTFSQPVPYICLLLLLYMTERNQNCQNEKVSTHPNVLKGSPNLKTPFSGWEMPEKNCSF